MSELIRLFVDLNETMIRTGQTTFEQQQAEVKGLALFVDSCRNLAREQGELELVFLTGNSFEYSRRIEEPLGLKNIRGINLIIVSENGLIARSFREGDLWRLDPTASYYDRTTQFTAELAKDPVTRSIFYSQGNEIRTTLKPVANEFSSEQLSAMLHWAHSTALPQFCKIYTHRFYFDIDPLMVTEDGATSEFGGKHFAASRLIQRRPARNYAFGDSNSDLPMFEAVNESGGSSFLVANGEISYSGKAIQRLTLDFIDGLNEGMSIVRRQLHV